MYLVDCYQTLLDQAIQYIGNMVKTSFGPQGLYKLFAPEDSDEMFITKNGYEMISQLEIEHPAGKVIQDICSQLNEDLNDGTINVIILIAELMRRGFDLINQKIHPSIVIQGYKVALDEATKFISEKLSSKFNEKDKKLLNTITSRFVPNKFLSDLIVNTFCEIQNTKNIKIITSSGQGIQNSFYLKGLIIERAKQTQAMPSKIENPKIACFDCSIQRIKLSTKYEISIDNSSNLSSIVAYEINALEQCLEKLINQGANVFITSKAIDSYAASYLSSRKCIGISRIAKQDFKLIASSSGATIINTLQILFDEQVDVLGQAQEVSGIQQFGQSDALCFKGMKKEQLGTLVIRGGNQKYCDDWKLKVRQAYKFLENITNSKKVVASGGAVEGALNIYLMDFSLRHSTLIQSPIYEFAEALLIVPKTLCVNSNLDSLDLIGKLRSVHTMWQRKGDNEKGLKYVGLDALTGKLTNNLTNGIILPLESQLKILKYAVEGAITLLSIDQMINHKKSGN